MGKLSRNINNSRGEAKNRGEITCTLQAEAASANIHLPSAVPEDDRELTFNKIRLA